MVRGGIIIGGSSVYAVSNYIYSSDEVSYTPSDQTWNVSSVSKALDDLREKAKNYIPIPTATKSITSNGSNIDVLNYSKVNVNVEGVATYLGTGQSFDLKSVRDDYASLTVDDFLCEPTGSKSSGGAGRDVTNPSLSVKINKTYNSSTGILTAYIQATGSADFGAWYENNVAKLSVKAYLLK